MIGIVLATHGKLAREYLAALEHFVGPQPRVRVMATPTVATVNPA